MKKYARPIALVMLFAVLVILLAVPYSASAVSSIIIKAKPVMVNEKVRCYCGYDGDCECVIMIPPID